MTKTLLPIPFMCVFDAYMCLLACSSKQEIDMSQVVHPKSSMPVSEKVMSPKSIFVKRDQHEEVMMFVTHPIPTKNLFHEVCLCLLREIVLWLL